MSSSSSRRDLLKMTAVAAAAAALPMADPASAQTPAADATSSSPGSPNLDDLVSLFDFELVAKRIMTNMAWEYINSAAADEITVRWNREAYDRIRLNPRVLKDVTNLDTKVTLFDQHMPFPVLLAPTALHKLATAEGEIATARGAGHANTTMVLSTMSSVAVEDVTRAAASPVWFQLYFQNDRGFTRNLIQRAEAAGCRALCVTVDTPIEGARNRQQRAHFQFPPDVTLPNLKDLPPATQSQLIGDHTSFGPMLISITWKDIDWILSFCKVPVLLKGILNADDAEVAVKSGVAGIIVSNHGARNLDTVPATIDALPRITDRVGDKLPVLVDGGIRRGTDIVKALACGAKAVLIGRPYLYGLAAGGADGVRRVLKILHNELMMAMVLTGRPTLASIDRSVLWDSA